MAKAWSTRKKYSLPYGRGDGDFDFLHAFGDNGWQWLGFKEKDEYGHDTDDEDLDRYWTTFLNMYQSEIYAVVTRTRSLCGEIGIAWLELRHYENDNTPMEYEEIRETLGAIILAEENLLRIGIPFCSDYNFHGKNVYQKKQKNLALRKRYGMENYIPWEERHPKNEEGEE